ncbi:MAG: glutamate--cysteine ligase [Porticoccaceae bacterium]
MFESKLSVLTQQLAVLDRDSEQSGEHASLRRILRGIEKESLRVTADGQLSARTHPSALGSALTHPNITTDFSEALLEFITPPSRSIAESLATLDQVHRFTYRNIGDELLWVNSMPCMLAQDKDIPVGQYGSSNIGRMKTIYRQGLGHRYGRLMQTIAGIHYNWSLPDESWALLKTDADYRGSMQDYKTERYLGLIRNFRRYFWLLLYLFGAAPAVCRTFVRDRDHQLQRFGHDDHSLHTPDATSLRMGNLGYQSNAQKSLTVCYNNLDSYVETLRTALTTPYAPYQKVGLKNVAGDYQQLSTALLQIENEFYSTIRPKRVTESGEVALRALWERGIEYIEVRCIDLNPFAPVGIDARQIHFLDTFLLFCLLEDSPPTDAEENRHMQENQHNVVYRGRDPQLELNIKSQNKTLPEWAAQLFTAMTPVAATLDRACGGKNYGGALQSLTPTITNPALTPAARVLAEMQESGKTYFRTAMDHAVQHREYFLDSALDPATTELYRELAAESHNKQRAIEAENELDFDSFLANYYAQYDFPLE